MLEPKNVRQVSEGEEYMVFVPFVPVIFTAKTKLQTLPRATEFTIWISWIVPRL